MYLYCQTWKLEVNPTKTIVIIFTKIKIKDKPQLLHIMVKILLLLMIWCTKVLLLLIMHLLLSIKHILEQGRKAMFSVLRKTKKLNLPVYMQL